MKIPPRFDFAKPMLGCYRHPKMCLYSACKRVECARRKKLGNDDLSQTRDLAVRPALPQSSRLVITTGTHQTDSDYRVGS